MVLLNNTTEIKFLLLSELCQTNENIILYQILRTKVRKYFELTYFH